MTELCFETTFTKENAAEIAEYIICMIDQEETLVDYDFHLSKGKFVGNDVNTWIRFDTQDNTLLKNMLRIITDETIEPTKARIAQFEEFRRTVQLFLSEEYEADLADKLRNRIFDGKLRVKQCPMEDIRVANFDITDVPHSARNVLVVEKEQIREIVPQSISADLYAYMADAIDDDNLSQDEVVQKLNKYVDERKSANDSKYFNVKSVKVKRSFFECQIDLFVNYSMSR